ncbi:acetyltransferase [Kroppenstedtia guangzhouensis]|uniref:Acetyltransferase n=1 Tax=Kroppenstedtia guangzhouensis TaxID=1274356 RepID=A0ABQ1GZM2_9BACL|nr:arylamine N-acetyltransferase [Kroppenstedtia guangzhouensis]GGA52945.1 acetyltransferase [Kroppenstedtia guangzhouensis]
MDIRGYLERIGADKPVEADYSGLEFLQRRHLFAVPFENLDIPRKVPIQLDENRIYDKVVRRHRGGFCYELNGLFHRLLEHLGYRARLVAGTVKKEEGGWALADSHATILVELGEWWLVDVGFGDSARLPLPLTGEERTDVSGTYRVVPVSGRERVYDLQRKQKSGSWTTRLRFSTQPKKLQEFAPQCRFNQTSPDSPFTGRSIVTLPTEEGRITLSGNTLVITKGETKQKEVIPSPSVPEVLRERFGIVLE